MKKIIREKGVIITGPTATGKTRVGARLARDFDGEIISSDSRQIYRRLDIGSGKDIQEYSFDSVTVPYHLIDIADPGDEYNLQKFQLDFIRAFDEILDRGKIPFVVGGSPLYISSIINRYSLPGGPPDSNIRKELSNKTNHEILEMIKKNGREAETIDVNNRNRLIRVYERLSSGKIAESGGAPEAEWLIIGTYLHRRQIHEKIKTRLEKRLLEGMLVEVEDLHTSGISWEKLEYFGLEYKWIALYLQGKIDLATMKSTLEARIRQFAKRQDIWFRKFENQGWKIHWKDPEKYDEIKNLVSLFIEEKQLPEPEMRISEIFYGPKSQ